MSGEEEEEERPFAWECLRGLDFIYRETYDAHVHHRRPPLSWRRFDV